MHRPSGIYGACSKVPVLIDLLLFTRTELNLNFEGLKFPKQNTAPVVGSGGWYQPEDKQKQILPRPIQTTGNFCWKRIVCPEFTKSRLSFYSPLCYYEINCNFIYNDVDNIETSFFQDFDVLYLLQAYVGAPICSLLPEKEVLRVNVESIRRIVNSLSKNQRVIGVCTNSGYGSVLDGICTEETPMKSISLYGKSKEENENIVITHPNSTSLRLATVWGASRRNRIDLMVNNFAYLLTCTGKLELFQGNFKRNFVHINDVVNTFFDIANDSRTFGQFYNFGQDDDNTTKEELAKFISSQITNSSIKFLEKFDPDVRNYNCSSQKLAKLGHVAKKSIKNDIGELIKFYQLFPPFGTENHKKLVSLMKNV